jgi:Fe-Mn family superoxide dismutase
VKGANTTLEKLAEARAKGDFAAINQLQKNLAFHLSGPGGPPQPFDS